MHFAYPIPVWVAALVVTAVCALAWLQYRRPLAPLTRAQKSVLVACRAAVLGVITLFLWHAAHRLRVTLHDFGLRQDAVVAVVVYTVAALGTGLSVLYLLRI